MSCMACTYDHYQKLLQHLSIAFSDPAMQFRFDTIVIVTSLFHWCLRIEHWATHKGETFETVMPIAIDFSYVDYREQG